MKKRVLAMLLALAMLVCLAACGGKDNSAGSNPGSNTGSNQGADSDANAGSGGDAAQTAGEFNPDDAADAMTIDELRTANGTEVKVPANLDLGVVMKSLSNEFWRTLEEGYEQAAADAGIAIDVDATTSENDEILQQTMTENFTTQGKTALLLSPISDSNLTSAVENANAAGVLTVNVNDGLIAQAKHYVGPNAAQNGELAAAWMSEKLGDQGEVAIVIGMPKAFAARQRTSGFKNWIAENNSGLTVVEEQNADWDRNKAKTLAANWIQNHPDLKGIFCNNDDMALGVVEAVREANADILVVGVDGIGEAYDSIRSGGLSATIDSFPFYMGQIATEVTVRSLNGETIPSVVQTPQALIDASNVDTEAASIINWVAPTYTAG